MVRKWIRVFLALMLTAGVSGCDAAPITSALGALPVKPLIDLQVSETLEGSGKVIKEERAISGIDSVELAGVGTLNIAQGKKESLVIQAEDNLVQHFDIDVKGNKLLIGVNQGFHLAPKKPVVFNLTVKRLNGVILSGTGVAQSGKLELTEPLTIELTGTGNVKIESLLATDLTVKLSGAGNVEISGGEVDLQTVTLGGTGGYKAAGLRSLRSVVKVTGNGNAQVLVAENLDASVSGSGSVLYTGGAIVKKSISGTGNVRKAAKE